MKKAQKVFIVGALIMFAAFLSYFLLLIVSLRAAGSFSFHLRGDLKAALLIKKSGITGEQIILYAILLASLVYLIVWLTLAIKRKRGFLSYLAMAIFAAVVLSALVIWVEVRMFANAFRGNGPVFVSVWFTITSYIFFAFFGLLAAFNGIALDAKRLKTAEEIAEEERLAGVDLDQLRGATLEDINKAVHEAVRLELGDYAVFKKDGNVAITFNMLDSYVTEEVVKEEPVKEEPVEEEPVEEAPVEEAPVEEAPVEEAPVEEAPVVVKPVEVAPKAKKEPKPKEPVEKEVIRRIPFQERFSTLEPEMVDKFNEIKSYALSYGLKSRVSNSGDTFRLKRKTYLKIMIAGKGLKIHYALDPADYADTTIPAKDYSEVKLYEEIPLQLQVKSNLSVKRAKKLIDDICLAEGLVQQEVVEKEHHKEFVRPLQE